MTVTLFFKKSVTKGYLTGPDRMDCIERAGLDKLPTPSRVFPFDTLTCSLIVSIISTPIFRYFKQ